MTEVCVHSAGGEDQIVVSDVAIRKRYMLPGYINCRNLGQQNLTILLPTHHGANGRTDISRRQ